MAQITGGVVSVEDGVKKNEEYAPARKVRVELHFDVPEGANSDEALDSVATKADAKVRELLGNTKAAPRNTTVSAKGGDDAKAEYARKVETGEPIARKPGRPPKAAVDPQAPVSDPILDGPQEAKPASDGLDDLMAPTPEPEKPITDADLNSAVTKKNAVLKNGGKIRDLIATFAPEGQKITLAQLPAAKRKEFLAKLDALS